MPVEIKELIIRTTVDSQNSTPNSPSAGPGRPAASTSENKQLQVDEILKMIKDKNER